jgi:hypothetical protein
VHTGQFPAQKQNCQCSSLMLQKLWCALCAKLLVKRHIILQHKNASPLTAHLPLRKTATFGQKVLPHFPCSPDLVPSDYPLDRRLDGLQSWSGRHGRENLWPSWDSNSDPLVIQPVPCHYTDSAIPSPTKHKGTEL